MACYRPIRGYQRATGGPVFFGAEIKDSRPVSLPCGGCIGCRIAKQESWALRCMLEAKMYPHNNSFVTLTYNDESLPRDGALHYPHFVAFMKALRQKMWPTKIRFFMAGEYGEKFDRPHYHALLFNCSFHDRKPCHAFRTRSNLFRSDTLEGLWKHGHSSIGEVEYASARYCASYIVSRRNRDDPVYQRYDSDGVVSYVPREFCQMSRMPGIGFPWLEKWWRDIYATGHNGVVVDGKLKRIPQYFNDVLDRVVGADADWYDNVRVELGKKFAKGNNSEARLLVREEVALARERFNKERRENVVRSSKCP